jgi:hypothetical protein
VPVDVCRFDHAQVAHLDTARPELLFEEGDLVGPKTTSLHGLMVVPDAAPS